MNQLQALLALLVTLSVSVERVVEMLKGIIPKLADKWPTGDNIRCAILQLIAASVGFCIAWQAHIKIDSFPNLPDLATWILLGLLSSGGSGVWNHALDIVQAVKQGK